MKTNDQPHNLNMNNVQQAANWATLEFKFKSNSQKKTSELRNQKLKTLWGSFSKLQTVDAEQLPAPIVTHESQKTFLGRCISVTQDATIRQDE